jgi:hypothetical protein
MWYHAFNSSVIRITGISLHTQKNNGDEQSVKDGSGQEEMVISDSDFILSLNDVIFCVTMTQKNQSDNCDDKLNDYRDKNFRVNEYQYLLKTLRER